MVDDTFYCPYADRQVPKQEATPEHIFPLALGGTNDFTLPVSRDANHVVGSKVDGAFVNQTLIAAFRCCYELPGHSKTPPELRTQIEVEFPHVGAKRVDVRATKDGVQYRVPPSRTPIVDNKSHFIGNADDLEKMRKADEERGLKVESIIKEKITIDLPPTIPAGGYGLTCSRFFAKVAFATFYRAFGTWSLGSPEMARLRRLFLDETGSDEICALSQELVQVAWFDQQDVVFEIEREFPDCHTIWITFTPDEGVLAYLSIFGVLAARVRLARKGTLKITDYDRLFLVNYTKPSYQERTPHVGRQAFERLYWKSMPGTWFRQSPRRRS